MTPSVLIGSLLFALAVIVATLRESAKKAKARERRELTEKQLQDELYAISKALEKIRACLEEGKTQKAIPPMIEISERLGKFSPERFSSLEWKEFCAAQHAEFQCLSEFLNENAKSEIEAYREQLELNRKQHEAIAKKEFVRKKLVPNLVAGTVALAVVSYVVIQILRG